MSLKWLAVRLFCYNKTETEKRHVHLGTGKGEGGHGKVAEMGWEIEALVRSYVK